jgi:hypothetical protein
MEKVIHISSTLGVDRVSLTVYRISGREVKKNIFPRSESLSAVHPEDFFGEII